jgi:hypothetical protein
VGPPLRAESIGELVADEISDVVWCARIRDARVAEADDHPRTVGHDAVPS